jgi:hypothetical protein
MHLAIVEPHLAPIVDDDAGVERHAGRVERHAGGVELHDREAAPDAVVGAGLPEGGNLRPVHRAHQLRIGVHRQAVQRVFGEDHEVHRAEIAPGLGDHGDDLVGLRGKIGPRGNPWQLQLHEADDDAVFALVETAETVHRRAPIW